MQSLNAGFERSSLIHSTGSRRHNSIVSVFFFPLSSSKSPSTPYTSHSQRGPFGSFSTSFRKARLFLNETFVRVRVSSSRVSLVAALMCRLVLTMFSFRYRSMSAWLIPLMSRNHASIHSSSSANGAHGLLPRPASSRDA